MHWAPLLLWYDFYPHSPCGERLVTFSPATLPTSFLSTLSLRRATTSRLHKNICVWGFLSTLSLRRATARERHARAELIHFYPRSPCGERLLSLLLGVPNQNISIHALLAESDSTIPPRASSVFTFLSTLSLRRATAELTTLVNKLFISIHALLAESDGTVWRRWKHKDISIHALLAESDN